MKQTATTESEWRKEKEREREIERKQVKQDVGTIIINTGVQSVDATLMIRSAEWPVKEIKNARAERERGREGERERERESRRRVSTMYLVNGMERT